MFEPEREPVYDSHRDKGRFRVETDRMEPVRRQRQHVLFPARQEQRVAFWAATLPARNNNYLPYDRRTRTVLPISGGTPLRPISPHTRTSVLWLWT